MSALGLQAARQIIAAAPAGDHSSPERRIPFAVFDAGADPLALARANGAPLLPGKKGGVTILDAADGIP